MAIAEPRLGRPPLWRRLLPPGPKALLNQLAARALDLANIILGSIPGAEPAKEIKEEFEAAIKER
jgi:hypothetical protein